MPDTNPPSPSEASSTTRSKGRATVSASSARSEAGAGRRKVNLVFQGKGGVGKTFVASLIGQFYQERGAPVICMDTDPVNASLSSVKALQARHVGLLGADSRIDIDALDAMIEAAATEDAHIVIDNGAVSFVPLSQYLLANDIPDLIAGTGKDVVIHTIITGSPAMLDTLKGLASVAERFPASAELVVWLNGYFGPIVSPSGKGFEAMPVYEEFRGRITGLVHLASLDPDGAGRTLGDMLARGLTFAEADQSPEFRLVAKQRLRAIKRPIWDQLAAVL